MATTFTAKDLEVYRDSLKEKKSKTSKPAEPPAKTPPSVAKVLKPPPKLGSDDEPLKERKPLSVVHKTSNTIKDPQKPSSPSPFSSTKQPDQWRKAKEAASKIPPPGKSRTSELISSVRSSDYKPEKLKSPREALPSKSPHVKAADDSKATGVLKPSKHASSIYQKSPSSSGAKAPPTFDMNAALCSECTRSASEGAVCFIGNDGRVSACTTRSALRLCKNLNCAANNPEYVAAMANAPKKYLISKRHLLKAQFGLKSRTGGPRSPNRPLTDAAGSEGMSPSQGTVSPSSEELSPLHADVSSANICPSKADDADLSLLEGSLRQSGEELSLFNEDFVFDKDDTDLTNGDVQDIAVEDQIDFTFHDGEVVELESPKVLIVESAKNISDNHHEDAGSLAVDNFKEQDDEFFEDSPMHRESKAEELAIKYVDLMSGEEVDAFDQSGNAVESTPWSQMRGAPIVFMTEEIDNAAPTMGCENAGEGSKSSTRDVDQDAENNQESDPQAGVDDTCVDDIMPIHHGGEQQEDEIDGGCSLSEDVTHLVDTEKSCDLTTRSYTHIEDDDRKDGDNDDGQLVCHTKSGDLAPLDDAHTPYANQKGGEVDDRLENSDDLASLVKNESGSDVPSPPYKQVDEIALLHGAEEEQTYDDMQSTHDNGYVEDDDTISRHGNVYMVDEDQSGGTDSSEEDEPDAMVRDVNTAENIVSSDMLEGTVEDAWNGGISKGQDGNVSSNSNSLRRQRRVVSSIVEEVSAETVILRKQPMQARKVAEEWLPNHAIEGVVHKLAPTGEAKVKVLVEAFESIISHTDAESKDTLSAAGHSKRAIACWICKGMCANMA